MKNAKCPPLAGKTRSALDGPMKDNPGINTEPEMSGSKGPDNPNMKTGYSKGTLNTRRKPQYHMGFHDFLDGAK